MYKFIVPFRMHNTGWGLVAICHLIGIQLGGWRLGFYIGVSLIASLLMHEVGHMLIAGVFRVPVTEFGLTLRGAYNRRARARRRRDEILISTAGPLMNLFIAIPLLFLPHIGPQLALCNFVLCLGNLLPIPSSDGLRILRTVWRPNHPNQLLA
jgi:Zn-dependent protease